VLVYDSDPLLADLEVTGPIRVKIDLSTDVPDVDLWARLLDVAPDGTAFNLMSPGLDVLRASHRSEKLKPELLTPGQIYRLELDRMVTSNVFRAGHRIRMQISGAVVYAFVIASSPLAVSQSAKRPVYVPVLSSRASLRSATPAPKASSQARASSSATRIAHVRIYHDAKHRSRIELPVIPR
jgi:putative CocE/NonD family hydrolase